MSALINVSIDVASLPKEKFVQGKNGKVYYNFTLSVNDETNNYGQNVSAFDAQTKEEREAKKAKSYLGNGKVVWTDGTCAKADWQDSDSNSPAKVEVEAESDLPF
jgi:hypothetical protein